jgi:transcriptional antiterminator NusG
MPIPISIEEYQKMDNVSIEQTNEKQDESIIETKKIYETNIKVGNTIEIIGGHFVGMNGEVKAIDLTKGQAKVEVEMFGRVTSVDVNFDEIKLAV